MTETNEETPAKERHPLAGPMSDPRVNLSHAIELASAKAQQLYTGLQQMGLPSTVPGDQVQIKLAELRYWWMEFNDVLAAFESERKKGPGIIVPGSEKGGIVT